MKSADSGSANWREQFKVEDLLPDNASSAEKAARGRRLERIFFAMLDEANLQPRLSFRSTGEEIDGSFMLAGRTLLLELKWRGKPQSASTLYEFMGKVSGKLTGTVGLFVSMSGFSPDAIDALVAGKEINLVLMDGEDVRVIVDGRIDIEAAIMLKLRAAAETGTPFLSVVDHERVQPAQLQRQELVLVEGRFDAHILAVLLSKYGTSSESQTVLPVGGVANFGLVAQTVLGGMDEFPNVTIVADGDGHGSEVAERIRQGMAQGVQDIAPRIVILEPTLESALGLFEAGEFAHGRRKVLTLSDELLVSEIGKALSGASPNQLTQVRNLATALRLQVPDLNEG